MSHCKKMPMPPDQVALFAQSVDESLARNSDVRFVSEAIWPVIGNIKWNMGLDRFLLDGKEGTSSETWLVCAAHNLMIYLRKAAPGARALFSMLIWVADWAAMRYHADFHPDSRGLVQLPA